MKRICPLHGLWNKDNIKERCPKCTTTNTKNYDKNYRDKESNKFYHSKAWKTKREEILYANPFCVGCGNPAQMVDHKIAIKKGGSKLDSENLQSMCNICHNKKENKEGNRWKR